MANHKSAVKKAKQDIVRRDRNRAGKSRLRGTLKSYRLKLAEGSEECKTELPGLISLIDRSAKHGFIHHNAANRLKAHLSKQTLHPAS